MKRIFTRRFVDGVFMRKLSSLFFLVAGPMLIGQDIAIGEWRSHLSYGQAKHLAVAKSTIFCATENGLFSFNTQTEGIRKLTKEDGFGDVKVSALSYSGASELLIIGYESGVVDLLEASGKITTLNTLRDAQVVSDKEIHSITSFGTRAYLATDFGVVFLDLSSKAIKENYRSIGPHGSNVLVREVLAATADSLWILTNQGIQAGHQEDNLLDFNAWNFYPETDNSFDHLAGNEQALYSIKNDVELWELVDGVWENTGITFSQTVNELHESGALYALTDVGVFTSFPSPSLVANHPLLERSSDVVVVSNELWVADELNGLLKLDGSEERIIPSGPISDDPSRMKSLGGNTYFFYGPEADEFDGTSDGLGYSFFDGSWSTVEILEFSNITDVAVLGGNTFFSSMGFGLYDETSQTILDDQNSELVQSNSFNSVQISGIAAGRESLWITTYNADVAVYELKSDGSIVTHDESSVGSSRPLDIVVSERDVLWMRRGAVEGSGIVIYDPFNLQSRVLRTADGLPSSNVTGISIDADDEAWIGTINGPANFSGASFAFNEFEVSRPVFDNGLLFEGEQINDVMTDGGNRIWFATNQGVWVISDDLTEVIHQFTSTNSGLLSDEVLSFAYDQLNGEVFMKTDKGVVSYRSGSSGATEIHASDIDVFPNPVPPGYAGDVGISGLARNAFLKITDSKGRLVQELQANGGTTRWDLRNHLGGRVATGVYLIFSSSADGTETNVGKIAVVR